MIRITTIPACRLARLTDDELTAAYLSAAGKLASDEATFSDSIRWGDFIDNMEQEALVRWPDVPESWATVWSPRLR